MSTECSEAPRIEQTDPVFDDVSNRLSVRLNADDDPYLDPSFDDVLIDGLSDWVLQDRQPEEKLKYLNLTGPIVNETQVEILKERLKNRLELLVLKEHKVRKLKEELEKLNTLKGKKHAKRAKLLKKKLKEKFLSFLANEWDSKQLDEHGSSSESDVVYYDLDALDEAMFWEERQKVVSELYRLLVPYISCDPIKRAEADMCVLLEDLYTEFEKQRWVDSWPKNGEQVQELIADTISARRVFTIIVASIEKEPGKFGLIIRDYRGYPIVAYTEYDASLDSEIHCELKGLSKALELANSLKLPYIYLYCRLAGVANYVGGRCQRLLHQCHHGHCLNVAKKTWCRNCVLEALWICDKKETKVSNVVGEIMDQLIEFEKNESVKKFLSITPAKVSYKKPVYRLVKRRTGTGKMNPWELKNSAEITEILFKEARGESGLKIFQSSLKVFKK